ncbi:MAG: hypothetical protein WCE90_11780 [Candidatus Zixiibacteriota bacterium]
MLNIIGYWVSAAMGGLFVAIIDWLRTSKRERQERHLAVLKEQIQCLYGPIYYLVSQNKVFFQASSDVHKAGEEVYFGKEWAPSVLEAVTKETIGLIETSNKYIELVMKNNDRIMEILNNNIYLAEIEDYEKFSIFVKDYFRLQVESGRILRTHEEADKLDKDPKLPLRVVLKLPRISFLDEDFFKMVETRFSEKKKEYRKYYK